MRIEPIKNKFYLVKVLSHSNEKLVGREVKVKFTGIVFRSLITEQYLYLSQIEILHELKVLDVPGNNSPESSNQTELAL